MPQSGFRIQVDADGPPDGAPEETTVVEEDLTIGEAAPVAGTPDPPSPDVIEPGFAAPYDFYVHCGVEWLPNRINDTIWRAATNDTPDAWRRRRGR